MPEKHSGDVTLPDIPVKLSAPARRALANAGITTLRQLSRKRESEVAALHGMGPTGIRALKVGLKEAEMAFAPERK